MTGDGSLVAVRSISLVAALRPRRALRVNKTAQAAAIPGLIENIQEEEAPMRIGFGFDVHAFGEDRKLFLGGIEIPHPRGLLGHSDADVLLHAVIDAVLGALSWGDIGSWFPDNDEQWKDASSKMLLENVWRKVVEEGWRLVNLDSVVVCESPRLRPYVESICTSLASGFGVDCSQVSVKGTTSEKLGFTGRGEGIAAQAVVLLTKQVQ